MVQKQLFKKEQSTAQCVSQLMRSLKQILFVTLMSINFLTQAQLDSILIRFNSFVIGDEIRLDWIIKGGYQCSGTLIQRSTDSIIFKNIGSISGTCGSPYYDESYSFTDIKPVKNAVNYYRIDLVGIGYSKIISRENYDLQESQALVIPNPIVAEGKIIFENQLAEPCSLEIYNASGILIFTNDTRDKQFQISRSQLPAGIYFFLIRKNDEMIGSGKLVVQ